MYQCSQSTGHPINVGCFSIVGRELHNFTRTIKEAMFIQVNDLSLERNFGEEPGMRSCRTSWPSTLGNPLPSPNNGQTSPHGTQRGEHTHVLHIGKCGPPRGADFPPSWCQCLSDINWHNLW